jgi:hypothetical protein
VLVGSVGEHSEAVNQSWSRLSETRVNCVSVLHDDVRTGVRDAVSFWAPMFGPSSRIRVSERRDHRSRHTPWSHSDDNPGHGVSGDHVFRHTRSRSHLAPPRPAVSILRIARIKPILAAAGTIGIFATTARSAAEIQFVTCDRVEFRRHLARYQM